MDVVFANENTDTFGLIYICISIYMHNFVVLTKSILLPACVRIVKWIEAAYLLICTILQLQR